MAWENGGGAPHTATAAGGEFDSGILDAGGGFGHRFERAGRFPYRCALHPQMVGEVVVCPACASPLMGVEELVVHGALHLSGMDHGEDFEGSEMASVQKAVMGEVRGEGD